MKILNALAFTAAAVAMVSCGSRSTKDEINPDVMRGVVQSQNYNIFATRMTLNDQNGLTNATAVRNLTEPKAYYITLTPKVVSVNLPSIGSVQSSDGINASHVFTKPYSYSANLNKNGVWEIVITPEAQRGINSIFIEIQKNGSAYFTVNSTDRTPTNYSGYIEN